MGLHTFVPPPKQTKKKPAIVPKSFSQGDDLRSCSPESSTSSGSPSPLSGREKLSLWEDSRIQEEALVSPLDRMGTCELEIDVCGEDILNVFHHPDDFADSSQPNADNQNPKKARCQLITSLAEIWEEERSRKVMNGDKASLTPPASPPRFVESL